MIESDDIHDPSRCIPFDIWTLAYMRALYNESVEDAKNIADRAVDVWIQMRLKYARERTKAVAAQNS